MKAFVLPTIFTAVDRFTSPVQKMNKQLNAFADSAFKMGRNFAVAGALMLAPLALMANSAVKFEDRMADVAKTSGLAGAELAGLGDDILSMAGTTRTPIEGLQKIAEIGGQMGIKGRAGVLGFTDSVNKFNVALGSDFSGGVEEAARAIGGLNTLFKETREMEVADSITKIGSAINALSAKGVKVPEVTEFINRMGQLPDAIKPSVQDVAALGATLTKLGVPAEIAARGVGDVLLTATQNAPAFAKQMGMSTVALRKMIDTNPVEFLKKFSAGFKGMDASKMGPLLKKLKLGDVGSVKVIGSLSTSMEMLTEFTKISNDEFEKGTSLLNEYNVKNETTAAKLAKAKNSIEALSISIGSELLPIISDLLADVAPIIRSFADWVKRNRPLVSTLAILTLKVAGFVFVISGIASIVGAITTAMAALNVVMALLAANPVVLGFLVIVGIIGLLIGIIYLLYKGIEAIIEGWNEWGAAAALVLAYILPPLGLVILFVKTFANNWDRIIKAFKEGGILAGLKAIGTTLLDMVLHPLQQILDIIAKVTGADWAKTAGADLKNFRAEMGVSMDGENGEGKSLDIAANPQAARNISQSDAIVNSLMLKNNLAIDINDPSGRAQITENSGGIPVKTNSTHKFGQ